MLKTNENASRFFLSYPVIPESSEVDIDKAIPHWHTIPNKKNNSVWLDFKDLQNNTKNYQVRNTLLDSDRNIWATTIIGDSSVSKEKKSGSGYFYKSLEALWGNMTENSSVFRNKLSELYSMIMNEFGLTSFLFHPSDIFVEFDLYSTLTEPVREKYGKNNELISKLANFSEKQKYSFVAAKLPQNQLTAWGFETSDKEFAGFFSLEGFSAKDESDIQMFCEFLSEKFKGLYTLLSLRRENYITKFENDINDIVNENIIEGIIITDEHFSVMYINAVAATMFGFSSAQVVGHKLEDLLVTSDGIQSLIDRGDADGHLPSIKYLHRRSGKIFPCQIKVCQMQSGYDTYNIFVLSDQTDTEESRLKAEQLTQKAFLGDFASMLAHEIRNPINNIQMWIANLYTMAEGNEEFLSGAQRVESDFQRITQLVNNILAFSKPMALNKEEIDLSLLISEIIEKWRLNFARKNITCYFTPPDDFPKFYGDPRSLEQVFNNLIGNSVDAFDGQDGIITLKLSLKENESGRKQILISESDNGPGIPEDKIDTIFEPFMTTKKNGNGWGLALSKRIITSHKGTIQVKSFQGGGTVFEILLPMNDEMG
ncbi:MAG: PAS domain-containing sensor histidine kinase [Anaerolineaceae bacterium]|nr:PAS domain-containing sensor histidine kinase [Anaerolineaceae bacterium]